MIRIGLISDTHGHIEDALFDYFADVDEIWHAGDMGDISVADRLRTFKPLKGVYGNCDGYDVRVEFKQHARFTVEETDVWITHIGGYPGNYAREVKAEIFKNPPGLFVCGHSHILKVIYDKKLRMLHINPGAAGNRGIHTVKTAVRFSIDHKQIVDLDVLEIKRQSL